MVKNSKDFLSAITIHYWGLHFNNNWLETHLVEHGSFDDSTTCPKAHFSLEEHGQSLSFLQLRLRTQPPSGSAHFSRSSCHQQQLLFMSWGAAPSKLARSDSTKRNIFLYLYTLEASIINVYACQELSHHLLIISPCPMLAGTPFSLSFRMHFSNAKAATLKKNPCTFSPENMKNEHFLTVAFCIVQNQCIYVVIMYHTALTSVSSWLLPVLDETDQNSACISVAILMASFSVLRLSSKGLRTRQLGTEENWEHENLQNVRIILNILTSRSLLVPTKKMKQESGSFSLMASSNHWL